VGRNLKILVTGGAGFLGHHLCGRLLALGHEVICLDDYSTGSRENIEQYFHNASFTVMEHDVAEPYSLPHVDQIYNLACPASPVHYQADPVRTTRTSVLGAINALDLAQRTDARVLQASTSEIYGDPLVHPQDERYWGHVNPIGLRACYDEGKRCAETLFYDYHRTRNVEIRVARIFNTYGPFMAENDGRVVSNYIVQALKGCPITIYGDGKQTRSFCYCDDLVDGLIALMNSDASCVEPVNLGNPQEFRVIDLAAKILRLTGSSSELVHLPLPSDDPRLRRPDISRARERLGWNPKVELEEGLSRTIAYFAERMHRASPGVQAFAETQSWFSPRE